MSTSTTTDREIDSQPEIWARALDAGLDTTECFGRDGEEVLFLGCGTSAFVAESLAVLRESAGLGRTDAAYASEYTPSRRHDRVVVISRSGTTSEVLDALALVPEGTATTSIVGVAGTAVAQGTDSTVVLDFADEESVVQTRFPTTVLALARRAFGEDVSGIIEQARQALARPLSVDPAEHDHFVFLGRSWTYGLAQEAALKIREAAQAWSESYPSLDYRHGPLAVASGSSLVMLFGEAEEDLATDIRRVGAQVLHEDLDPLVQLIQAQRIAVALAAHRGLDPDTPRHLTRSVVLA